MEKYHNLGQVFKNLRTNRHILEPEFCLCLGAAFSHLRTSPTCDMMGTTKSVGKTA